jgi:DNA (cytosine-5)-methyltransferase 1
MLKLIDLCAGTGGFTLAFEETKKVECIYANDISEKSKKIYDENYKHKLTLGNICDIKVEDIPEHDILTAGFPCQPFSIAGKLLGFNDERSNVFWKIKDIIAFHKPRFVILENVKNLESHDNGNTLKIIKDNLNEINYKIKYKVLDTCKYTEIPQHRERIFIICFKNIDDYDKFDFDFNIIENKRIIDFLEKKEINQKYYYNDETNNIHKLILSSVIKRDTIYQFRRVYVRENKNHKCPTLTANMGSGGHNIPIIKDDKGVRKLTPRECFNFQGFPDNYKLSNLADSHLYKLAGNAITIPIITLIAKKLINII